MQPPVVQGDRVCGDGSGHPATNVGAIHLRAHPPASQPPHTHTHAHTLEHITITLQCVHQPDPPPRIRDDAGRLRPAPRTVSGGTHASRSPHASGVQPSRSPHTHARIPPPSSRSPHSAPTLPHPSLQAAAYQRRPARVRVRADVHLHERQHQHQHLSQRSACASELLHMHLCDHACELSISV
jgi:hypothetical protein